jgi:hypothetical protein
MKKLNKLRIDSKKLMKNEELITFKGGYPCTCYCGPCENYGYFLGIDMYSECEEACESIGCKLFEFNCM